MLFKWERERERERERDLSGKIKNKKEYINEMVK